MVLVQLVIERHPADSQGGSRAATIVPVSFQRFGDAANLGFFFGFRRRRERVWIRDLLRSQRLGLSALDFGAVRNLARQIVQSDGFSIRNRNGPFDDVP